MDKHFLGTITCVASDRLITDENGEQFYECMTQEELNAIQVSTDKNAVKSNLFYALGRMDAILSAVVGQITKNRYVEIVFAIKDGGKSIALNISNDRLNGNEVMALGLIEIGVGIGIAILAPSGVVGVVAGLIISSFVSYFLADLYLYLKDKALHLWQEAKDLANSTWQNIMSLIESDERSLEERKRDITNKVTNEILNLQETPNENFIKNISQENYNDLIHLLCQEKTDAKDIHQYLEDSKCIMCNIPQQSYTPLSPQGISFPYSSIIYLTTIKALKDTLKEYLPKAKKIVLYTPNPFVSLYTSSPFYIFNSNLSFFNPHLQYLLTSKDTQQWLYDILFSLARDNREIIVYEWGGSIEELDSKESQANKKDLDSINSKQSNIKESKEYKERLDSKESQVGKKDSESNFSSTLKVA